MFILKFIWWHLKTTICLIDIINYLSTKLLKCVPWKLVALPVHKVSENICVYEPSEDEIVVV